MSKLLEVCCASCLGFTLAAGAVGQANTAAEIPAEDLQQHLTHAQAAQQKGDLDTAAHEYRAFLAGALLDLGTAYASARDFAEASRLLEQARLADPTALHVWLEDAQIALSAGDLQKAKTLSSELITKASGDRETLAEAHQVLGRTLLQLQQDGEARKQFEAAVALNPTFPNGYDLAVACLDLADEACAVQVFKEMETAFGDKPDLHMAFGRAYADSDFQPHAVTEFERVIAEDPHRPGAHYLLAAVLLASGGGDTSTQEAEAALTTELSISPHDPMSYAALGQIALIRTDYPKAIELLKKAVQYGPDVPEGYLYLGQAYYDTGNLPEAATAFRNCIRLTTDPARNRYQVQKAHYLLGRILLKQGQADAAHLEMATARELADKTLAGDKRKLTGLMEANQSSAAQSGSDDQAAPAAGSAKKDPVLLRKADKLKSDLRSTLAVSYDNLGVMEATREEYVEAARDFSQAAGWDASLAGLDFNWGRTAFTGHLYAEAVGPLARYVRAHPEDDGAQNVLGLSEFLSNDYKGCVATLQPLALKQPLPPSVEYAYAESLVQTGALSSGVEHLLTLEKTNPEVADVHRALGEALHRLGRDAEASRELRQALQQDPADATAHFDLGQLDMADGHLGEAITELETATRLTPREPLWHKELAAAYTAAHRNADATKELSVAANMNQTTAK